MLGRQDARAPMLPGELKRLQRAAKQSAARSSITDENADPAREDAARTPGVSTCRPAGDLPHAPSPKARRRSGLAAVSENSSRYIGALEWPSAALHMRRGLVLSLRTSDAARAAALLHAWQRSLASVDSVGIDDAALVELAGALDHYRYPFPALPANMAYRLSKPAARSGTPAVRRPRASQSDEAYFAAVAGGWRRALLSLYGSWRRGRVDYFYVLQAEFSVLFVRGGGRCRAYVSHAPPAMLASLSADGITVVDHDAGTSESNDPKAGVVNRSVAVQQENGGVKQRDCDPQVESPASQSQTAAYARDDDEDPPERSETPDVAEIKREIEGRAMRAGRREAQQHSAAPGLAGVSGDIAAHVLLDWLINQRDTAAAAVLPTLVSPGPFLGGALCRTALAAGGPLANTAEVQVHLGGADDGAVLPGAVAALRRALECALGPDVLSVRSQSDDDDRTSAFSRVHKD